VLEVGCGNGELSRHLAAAGWDVTGIDPEAPTDGPFVSATLEEFHSDVPFDAAVAIRSLHHLEDLDLGLENLASLLLPAGRLVLFEFAVEHVDEAAASWLAERELALPVEDEHRSEVWELATLRGELEARFSELLAEPAPYLAREGGHPELEPEECEANEDGTLRAAGMRLVYEKPGRLRPPYRLQVGSALPGAPRALRRDLGAPDLIRVDVERVVAGG
jgi:SAM-dependent methyltransferase